MQSNLVKVTIRLDRADLATLRRHYPHGYNQVVRELVHKHAAFLAIFRQKTGGYEKWTTLSSLS